MLQRFPAIAFLAISMGSYASKDQSEQARREEVCIKARKKYHDICQNKSFHFTNPAKSAECFGTYHTLMNLCKQSHESPQDQPKQIEEHKEKKWDCDDSRLIYKGCMMTPVFHKEGEVPCVRELRMMLEACKNGPFRLTHRPG